MIARVLGAALPQVLRSVAWLLLPTSFIALLAWATAGSATGNTGDPLRAALWIWIGAHSIPFDLSLPPSGLAGHLSYLPLGALIFPVLAIRNGVARTIERLDNDSSLVAPARAVFAAGYTLFALAASLFSKTESIRPVWYFALIYVLPFSLLCAATVGRRVALGQGFLYGSRIIALLLGVSAIVFGLLLLMNISVVKNLTTVLQPGIFGGFLLLILNILYIPNAIVSTLAYFSGVGFAVGSGTLVSPLSFRLNKIPAMPLLGALPDGKSMISLIGILFVVAAGALLVTWTISLNQKVLIQSLIVAVLLAAFVGYSGSGALITDAMSAVGVSTWKFTLAIAAELGLGALLALYIPRVLNRR
ncbi:MAG: DUF6350 family protein [Candidatus Planktophila sp.]|jgi:hypothetical protein|nr:DUF6350 family protein [Candidatus Planktophila sp.]